MAAIGSLFGGSSAKRDRADQLSARSDLWQKVFAYALPEGKNQESGGSALQGQAGDYFGRLIRAGRGETQQTAAPAINADLAATDATRRREASLGTGRTGGTAEVNRYADADATARQDNIVNSTMQNQKAVGAQGAAQVGSDKMRQALGLLGLSEQAITTILNDSRVSRGQSQQIRNSAFDRVGGDIGNLVAGFM